MDIEKEIYLTLGKMKRQYDVFFLLMSVAILGLCYLEMEPKWLTKLR